MPSRVGPTPPKGKRRESLKPGPHPPRSQPSPARISFRRLVERAPDIIYRYRLQPERRMEYISPAIEQILGYLPADFYADPDLAYTMVEPADADSLTAPDAAHPQPVVTRWTRKDGTQATIEDRPVALLDDSGAVVVVEGVARDVTTQVAAEAEVRLGRERLEALVNHAPVVLWATDEHGRLTFVRGAALLGLGLDPDELVGMTLAEMHRDARPFARLVRGALAGHFVAGDGRLGNLVFASHFGPLRDERGAIIGVTGVSIDVTRERRLAASTERDAQERHAIAASLRELDLAAGVDDVAQSIVSDIATMEDFDNCLILAFGPAGFAYPLALAGEPLPLDRGHALPGTREQYLRERAESGSWVERWVPRVIDASYGIDLADAGVRAVAYVPLRHGNDLLGLLCTTSFAVDGHVRLERRMAALSEFGDIAGAVLGPTLAARQHLDVVRDELEAIIHARSFSPVYQPIVALRTGAVVGYEALTRFSDGTPPERRFIEAASVGLKLDLEIATLQAALDAANALPVGMPLAVNVSPPLILENSRLAAAVRGVARPMTLEVTERVQVTDYTALRTAIGALGAAVRLAVDDTGAGYASLRHVMELRPDEIKIDREFVTGAAHDTARQAVIAGLVRLAQQTNARLIAEGVETEAERQLLIELGVEFGQGYLLGRPAAVTDLTQARSDDL
jgi:PAS domain S-box-containing protein